MVFSLHIIYPNPISGTKGGTLARIKATSPLEHWHLATVSYWSKIKIIWTVKLANLNRSSACRIFIFRSSDCSLINAQSSSWISRSDKIFEILDSKTLIITYYSIRHRLEFTLCTCMLRYNRIHWQRSCQRNLGKQAWTCLEGVACQSAVQECTCCQCKCPLVTAVLPQTAGADGTCWRAMEVPKYKPMCKWVWKTEARAQAGSKVWSLKPENFPHKLKLKPKMLVETEAPMEAQSANQS